MENLWHLCGMIPPSLMELMLVVPQKLLWCSPARYNRSRQPFQWQLRKPQRRSQTPPPPPLPQTPLEVSSSIAATSPSDASMEGFAFQDLLFQSMDSISRLGLPRSDTSASVLGVMIVFGVKTVSLFIYVLVAGEIDLEGVRDHIWCELGSRVVITQPYEIQMRLNFRP